MHIRLGRLVTGASLVAALIIAATPADARIRIRFLDGNDAFEFHAQIFDPSYRSNPGDLRIEAWNANGMTYSVEIPIGTCVDTGGACVYRDPAARHARSGLAYFRILYQTATHGNKIWLVSYGDLSAATEPVMSFKIYLDDVLYAHLDDVPLAPTNAGWVGF